MGNEVAFRIGALKMNPYEILVTALWLGVASLEPDSNEIAVGGLRYTVEPQLGRPVLDNPLIVALTAAIDDKN